MHILTFWSYICEKFSAHEVHTLLSAVCIEYFFYEKCSLKLLNKSLYNFQGVNCIRSPLGSVDYTGGNKWMGVSNSNSSGKSLLACGYINLYDCRIVTSATPAMSPISFWLFFCFDACDAM